MGQGDAPPAAAAAMHSYAQTLPGPSQPSYGAYPPGAYPQGYPGYPPPVSAASTSYRALGKLVDKGLQQLARFLSCWRRASDCAVGMVSAKGSRGLPVGAGAVAGGPRHRGTAGQTALGLGFFVRFNITTGCNGLSFPRRRLLLAATRLHKDRMLPLARPTARLGICIPRRANLSWQHMCPTRLAP